MLIGANLLAGAVLVIVTVVIHSVGLFALWHALAYVVGKYALRENRVGATALVTATVLGLCVLHAIEIWAYAVAYFWLGALPNLHDALFFSTLSFSTLGAEEISTTAEWQLFGSIEGVNGFLLIGWSTAYLVTAWTRYGPLQEGRDL